MPPQPLAMVRPNGQIILGQGELSQHPKYAALVMAVIEQWANAENIISQMVARFLSADFNVVMAMLQALTSTGRRAALIGAAQEALSTDDFNLFRAVMKATKPSRDRRNDFAHHIWGVCPQIPDAMLLADPKVVDDLTIQLQTRIQRLTRSTPSPPQDLPEIDRMHIYVYRDRDLIEEVEAAHRAYGYIHSLNLALGSQGPVRDAMQTELLRQPPIQQALEHLSSESDQ